MKRPRPYIPVSVRLAVAFRQLRKNYSDEPFESARIIDGIDLNAVDGKRRLDLMLLLLCHGEFYHLDHDPALINRDFNPRTGKYTPDANDPHYLVYRTKTDHDIKTRVHGDGAQHSDLALRRKNKRIARNRDPHRRKAKIVQRKRAWPKRKFGRRK